MSEFIFGIIILALIGITVYGAGHIIVDHFWIAALLFFVLPPIFFIWAFIKGISELL